MNTVYVHVYINAYMFRDTYVQMFRFDTYRIFLDIIVSVICEMYSESDIDENFEKYVWRRYTVRIKIKNKDRDRDTWHDS